MKIIYELDSDNPDHKADIEMMHNAYKYWSALREIDQKIRSWQKHCDDGKYETAAKVLDEIRDEITESGAREVN
jgi:hypothetical protein